MDRIGEICSRLPKAEIYADVGCDHGYCARYLLQNRLAETVWISDISKGSLSKAERLLEKEIEAGRCIPVVCDGMKGLPLTVDCVLIAGLGGEEIVRILKEGYLPKRFVLQPMKNSERVREYLVACGAAITEDISFGEEICYDILVGKNTGGSSYSDWELRYGRDNLKLRPAAFLSHLRREREKLKGYLRSIEKYPSREEVIGRIDEIEVILNAVEEDL